MKKSFYLVFINVMVITTFGLLLAGCGTTQGYKSDGVVKTLTITGIPEIESPRISILLVSSLEGTISSIIGGCSAGKEEIIDGSSSAMTIENSNGRGGYDSRKGHWKGIGEFYLALWEMAGIGGYPNRITPQKITFQNGNTVVDWGDFIPFSEQLLQK